MRLRTLTEAECYARIYGAHGGDAVQVVKVRRRPTRRPTVGGEQLRERFAERLDSRGPEAEAA
jgi:hypothetical protein